MIYLARFLKSVICWIPLLILKQRSYAPITSHLTFHLKLQIRLDRNLFRTAEKDTFIHSFPLKCVKTLCTMNKNTKVGQAFCPIKNRNISSQELKSGQHLSQLPGRFGGHKVANSCPKLTWDKKSTNPESQNKHCIFVEAINHCVVKGRKTEVMASGNKTINIILQCRFNRWTHLLENSQEFAQSLTNQVFQGFRICAHEVLIMILTINHTFLSTNYILWACSMDSGPWTVAIKY